MVVLLALPLLVLGVVADHPHDTFAADDLALVADLSNAGSDFHCSSWRRCGSRLAERQPGDDTATWIETGPADQHTLPRPYVHTEAPRLRRQAGREDSLRRRLGLEAVQLLGQLSDHCGLEGVGVRMIHREETFAPRAVDPRVRCCPPEWADEDYA
jgi:hypothetical protein